MGYYDEKENKLDFRDWKVFIDNTSQWFDDINKLLSECYTNTNLIKNIYPKIRTFTSSRSANIDNVDELYSILDQVADVLYSSKYNELKKLGQASDWDMKLLRNLDRCIRLLSKGLSDGELTPKTRETKALPYELQGNVNDMINKALTKNNNTSINKNGEITANST